MKGSLITSCFTAGLKSSGTVLISISPKYSIVSRTRASPALKHSTNPIKHHLTPGFGATWSRCFCEAASGPWSDSQGSLALGKPAAPNLQCWGCTWVRGAVILLELGCCTQHNRSPECQTLFYHLHRQEEISLRCLGNIHCVGKMVCLTRACLNACCRTASLSTSYLEKRTYRNAPFILTKQLAP